MHIFLTFSFVFLGYAKISSLIVVNNKKNIEVKKKYGKILSKKLDLATTSHYPVSNMRIEYNEANCPYCTH